MFEDTALEDLEPYLDLVHPRRMNWCPDKVKAAMVASIKLDPAPAVINFERFELCFAI